MTTEISPDRVYTRAEVGSETSGEVIFIVHDKVYDATTYLDHHPGGAKILREVAGVDATAAFEDVGHSEDARAFLDNLCIGVLAEQERTAVRRRAAFQSKRLLSASLDGQRAWLAPTITLSIGQATASKLLLIASALLLTKLIWPELLEMSSISHFLNTVPAVWKGIAFSSAGSAACFLTISYQFSKTIVMTKGFRIYPPVMKPGKALLGAPISAKVSATKHATPLKFTPMQLVDRRQITTDAHRIVLQSIPRDATIQIPAGQHVQLQGENEAFGPARSYTPISAIRQTDGTTKLEFAIKVYPDGKMGNHLLNLPIDATLGCRGPLGSYKDYHRFLCDQMCVLAGGSGITPMYALIKRIVHDQADNTTITLLYANKNEDSIMLRDELDTLTASFPNKLQIHYFVGPGNPADSFSTSQFWHRGRIGLNAMQSLLPAAGPTTKYLVCGPDGFRENVMDGLVELGARRPEPVGHPTDQVFVF